MIWQQCPQCKGTGEPLGATQRYTCTVCHGQKIISTISGLPPKPPLIKQTDWYGGLQGKPKEYIGTSKELIPDYRDEKAMDEAHRKKWEAQDKPKRQGPTKTWCEVVNCAINDFNNDFVLTVRFKILSEYGDGSKKD